MTATVCVKCSAPMGRDALFCPKCGTGRPEEATVVSHVSLRNAQAAHLAESTRGEFEIMRQLGLGAMGSVYLAKDTALSRMVAIKVIASNLLQDESMVSRFRLEAQTVASLRHPNIVNVHAVRQADDLHYFVMDFIDGPALRSIIKGHAPLDVPIVQALLYQIGTALDYAHHRGKGVIHRDIKPANIMVDREGNSFVTDFGISKIAESQTGLTQTGATIGTPEYMSPEQCRGEELTGASDQYAVGIMAYEMLCGKTPFSGSQYFIMVAHTSEEPEPIMQLRPDCPPHVAEAVHRMLAKTAEERWPDLESGIAAMGGGPMGRKDPIRRHIMALTGSTAEVRALDTASPLPPVTAGGPTGESTGGTGPSTGPDSGPATSVTLLGLPARVEEGDTFTLSADVRGTTQESIPGVSVSWMSTDPAIAVVTGGRVQAVKAGTAVISAAVGQITNSVSVHVAEATADAVVIEPNTIHVSSGQRVSLSAQVQDKNGRQLERRIRWLTSDASVASVTRAGEVVATGSGVATVTAESGGVTGTAEVIVQGTGVRVPVGLRGGPRPIYKHPAVVLAGVLVLAASGVVGGVVAGVIPMPGAGTAGPAAAALVASVEVTSSEDSVVVGDSVRISARPLDSDGVGIEGESVVWTSGDDAIAEVRSNGWVVARAAGPVTLTAMVGGIQGLVDIVVTEAEPTQVASNTDSQPPPPGPGATTQSPAAGRAASRQPDPPPSRTADSPPGQSRNPQTGNPTTPPEEEPEVEAPPQPSAIRLRVPSNTMVLGDQQAVSMDVVGPGGALLADRLGQVQLRSSDTSVLTVNQGAGTIQAVGGGTTDIVASLGSLSQRATVSVEVPVATVQIEGGDQSLEIGGGASLSASVSGPGGVPVSATVTWSSSDARVATVDGNGRIAAVGEGSAQVVASADGVTDAVNVAVAAPTPALPSSGEARALVDDYVASLNSGDEDAVRALHGTVGSSQRDALLELMGQNNFEASIDGFDGPALSGSTAQVDFTVEGRYRLGFGGSRNETHAFRATFSLAGSSWRLASVIMLPD